MKCSRLLLLALPCLLSAAANNGYSKQRTNGEAVVEKMRMGKDSFEAVRDMHYMWYVHSVKALLVQVAKGVVPQLDKASERDFLLCLHRIPVKTDIVRTAECLVQARRSINDHRRTGKELPEERAFIVAKSRETGEAVQVHKMKLNRNAPTKSRKINERKLLLRKKISSNKAIVIRQPQNQVHRRVKRSEYRLVEQPGTKSDKRTSIKRLHRLPNLHNAHLTPIQRISQAISKIVRSTSSHEEKEGAWSETYKSILKLKKQIDGQHKSPGARVYDLPMERLVFDKKFNDTSSTPSRPVQMPALVQQAFSLADSIRSHSSKTRADPNYKMLSPRFAPVLPDKYEGRGLLSPSILSFYKDDSEDQIVPLPSLLEATGMDKKDRESLLEMIMEVSGARRTVDEAVKTLKKMNVFGVEGPFLEATKKIQDSFNDVEKSFTRRQSFQMKRRQFTFLDKNQLMDVYQKQGITEEQRKDFDLDEYSFLTHKQREAALWKRIEAFAANKTEVVHRSKRQTFIPGVLSVLNPTVLSPYMFSPVFGLTVLGPVVLSPSLFSPLILNPAMLSPYVLSPAVGMPFILSPYVLSPYVLSPLVMAPFILTPYVLSPNVINPYILSPLILSPLVLCPDVLSPMVLGGAILSPAVGSPALFSKSTLMASVLSPSVLS